MENAVKIDNINIVNDTFRMENISLDIKKGFITAITGGNGSGKTTLMGAVAGLNGITGGSIMIGSYDLHMQPVKAKNLIGFIFHKCPFKDNISPGDCMKMFGRFYDNFDEKKFVELCEEFNVGIDTKIRDMSKGQAVKLQFAFAMSHDAKVYLFDDATEGLDPVFRRTVKKILKDIVADGEHTVIMATKIPEDMENIVDYVVKLEQGKIVDIKDIEEINDKYKGGVSEYLKKGE